MHEILAQGKGRVGLVQLFSHPLVSTTKLEV